MALASQATIDTQLNTISSIIATGIEKNIEAKIKEAIRPYAEKIIEEAAKELSKSIVARMSSYREYDNIINITLMIDGKKHNDK